MKVFVTGGTGFVGNYIIRELKAANHSIRALVRKGSEKKLPFTDDIEIVHGDVTAPFTLSDHMPGCDAVIHLVGIIREFPGKDITYEKMHFDATNNMVDAAVKAGVKRFVHMSANGASEKGVSGYQTTKWRAEQLVINSGLKWTIFRPSVVFGDSGGRMEFTRELANAMRQSPVMPMFGGGTYMLEPVAVTDVAACFVKSLSEPLAERRIFHLGGGHPMEFKEIAHIIAEEVGRHHMATPSVPMPMIKSAARLLGGFSFFPVTVDQLDMLEAGNVCPEHDYIDVFGVQPVDFKTVDKSWLRRAGK